jgi:3-oxoacyl-[acyl-carrier-protein] synthase-3
MTIEIKGTGKGIPSRRVSNEEIVRQMETSDEWIRSHTGIGARHIVSEENAASDLAVEAARQALDMAGLEAESLDLIVIGTATPDFQGCPSTACIVQNRLGAKHAGAMDLAAGCTGFIYGLETAAALLSIKAGRRRALVIGADVLSRITDWNDRGTCVLFGDGAGAVALEKTDAPSEGPGKRGLLRSILGADGSGAEYLMIKRGGSRYPWKPGETMDSSGYLKMNGRAVYNFAVKAMTDTIESLLKEEGVGIEEVARIIPHQANARIVQAAGKRLGIPEEMFFLNIEEYANTSAASIPIALDELNRAGGLSRGDLVMSIGFGGGLTYGGNLIIW